jgi:hypothetical protein
LKPGKISEASRVSGLLGLLSPTEGNVVESLLAGRNPAADLAKVRGKERITQAESRDVQRAMASERVRRTIAGVTVGIRPGDLRRWVLERLVTEAEDATEGATRIKAVELVGRLPGVDAWTPERDKADDIAATGAELAEALRALEDRLAGVSHGKPGVDADMVVLTEAEPGLRDGVMEADDTGQRAPYPVQATPDPWDE